MKPPPELPLEIVLLAEAFARRLGVPPSEFWAIVYRKQEPPPGWSAAWAEAFAPLTSLDENGTLRTMRATEIAPARRGRPVESGHPLFAALTKEGKTLADEAAEIKRSTSSIRSFCYPKDHPSWRPVPEDLKQRWFKKYGVPLKTWH